jgi:hypothetical protein
VSHRSTFQVGLLLAAGLLFLAVLPVLGASPGSGMARPLLQGPTPTPTPTPAPGDCPVTTNSDSGADSLRNCIQTVSSGGRIGFDPAVFPVTSPVTITLAAISGPLPEIVTSSITIDGNGAGVILDGSNLAATDDGLVISGANDVTIRGLYILNFPGDGIRLSSGAFSNTIGGSNSGPGCAGDCNLISNSGEFGVIIEGAGSINNIVSGNFIGTDASGTALLPNVEHGIVLATSAHSNTIGGATREARNVIAGHGGAGMLVGSDGNTIGGNYIGTDESGTAKLGNVGDGIKIYGGVHYNTVGGSNPGPGCAGECNLISGNAAHGISIEGSGTTTNSVYGNYFGTNISGTTVLSNGLAGISVDSGANNAFIGGADADFRNLISGNGDTGLIILSDNNTVFGNYIGTDPSGTVALPNREGGVYIGGNGNTIGGNNVSPRCAGACNLISGNIDTGLAIGGDSNTIVGNYIGTNLSGTLALPNTGNGVAFWSGDGNTLGGLNIGPGCVQACNLISGNDVAGVDIDNSDSNFVYGNYIGTNFSGFAAISNAAVGIKLHNGASNNQIGVAAASQGNLISGNGAEGVWLRNSGTVSNTIVGNYIGTSSIGTAALPNGTSGVMIADGAAYNTVGGANIAANCAINCNLISGNGQNGVVIENTDNNHVMGNYIGVNLAGSAALPNQHDGVLLFNGATYNAVGGVGEANLISGNGWSGVKLDGSGTSSNTVRSNRLGTDVGGNAAIPNARRGVEIQTGATYNIIGGGAGGEGNLISGNSIEGVFISGSGTASNTVAGNYIGTGRLGTADLGNSSDGVLIHGGASGNIIGGFNTVAGEPCAGGYNLISGNDGRGVTIQGAGTGYNTVAGNCIGTNVTSTDSLGNGAAGIRLESGAANNIIGSSVVTERNLVSGNSGSGIVIKNSGTAGNSIIGNIIGLDDTGSGILGNGFEGIKIYDGAARNTVGGSNFGAGCNGDCNLISGNYTYGIFIADSGTSTNTVSGNYIGTDITGSAVRGNSADGIRIETGASHNIIGGLNSPPGLTCDEACNLISGNGGRGISIIGGATQFITVTGNYVGTGVNGSASLGNGSDGVGLVSGAANNTIGGNVTSERNVISGNGGSGVLFSLAAGNNTILGNAIGTDAGGGSPLGNSGSGVRLLSGAFGNVISDNVIAYSQYLGDGATGCGIYGPAVSGNQYRRNSIYNNDDKAICANSSATNRPVILARSSTAVTGTARANSTIDVFSDAEDEGQYYHGTVIATAAGKFSYAQPLPFTGPNVTVSATDSNGTSELATLLAGKGVFESTGQTGLGDENSQDCALSDIDVDGDLDVICANRSPNVVWLNDGHGTFYQDTTQTLGEDDSQAVQMGDIDGDDFVDALIANDLGAPVQVWLNDGSGTFELDARQALVDFSTQAAILEDLNGDGHPDLVLGHGDTQNQVWLNDGDGVFVLEQTLNSPFFRTRGLAAGDLDNDGDPDLFVANGDGQADELWLNVAGNYFEPVLDDLGQTDSQAVALGYLDNNNQLDAVVANGSGQPDVIWYNVGGAVYFSRTLPITNSNAVAIGRFNDDPYADIVLASDSDQPNYILINGGDGHNFRIEPIPCNSDADSQGVAIGDLDNDGDLDIFVANGNDEDGEVVDEQTNQVLKNLNDLRNMVGVNGGTLSFGQGMTLTIEVPAGALTQTTAFSYTPETIPADGPPDSSFAGRAFSLNREDEGHSFSGNHRVTTTLMFDPARGQPRLFYYDEGDELWADIGAECGASYSYGEGWLRVAMCHMTRFGIFTGSGVDSYLPAILKAY